MGKKDIFFLLLLLMVLIMTFIVTESYPSGARLFPLIVISLCGVFVIVDLIDYKPLDYSTF